MLIVSLLSLSLYILSKQLPPVYAIEAAQTATSSRSKLLPILPYHLVTNLLGRWRDAGRNHEAVVSTIHARLHVNLDVNRGHT